MDKIVNGKQWTILCNVEDLKMSHVYSNILSGVLSDIDAEYGKIAKIITTRGKIHKYLGMTIDYSSPVK